MNPLRPPVRVALAILGALTLSSVPAACGDPDDGTATTSTTTTTAASVPAGERPDTGGHLDEDDGAS